MLRLVWNIDPVLLHVGPFQLRWYGLLFAAGILAAYRAGVWSFERAGGSREEASQLLSYVVAGTIIGEFWLRSRLGPLGTGRMLRTLLKTLVACAWGGAGALLILIWLQQTLGAISTLGAWVALFLGTAVGGVIMFGLMVLLRVRELDAAKQRITRLVRRH